MCYDVSGQLDDALLWYQRTAELDPGDPDPLYNIAEILFRRREFAQAERMCHRALALFDARFSQTQYSPFLPPGEPLSKEELLANMALRKAFACYLMSLIQVNQGKLRAALESVRDAIQLYPKNAKWHLLMGQIYHQLGHHREGQAALARARQLDPNILAR
jgi:Flp pilus assembly protein TadD